jgi:alpha-ketoglutarate-dependent taurine dioxygenase
MGRHARAEVAIPRGRDYVDGRAWELAGDAAFYPSGWTVLRRRGRRARSHQTLAGSGDCRNSRRHGQVRRAGLSRSGLHGRAGTGLRQPEDYRLPTTFADVSNLDKDNKPFARDDRRRLFAIGNRLWHSDSSFKIVPAKYSLLHARRIPSRGGNTELADMRAAYDALDHETKELVEDLVCEHSQMFSRAKLGFGDFTAD